MRKRWTYVLLALIIGVVLMCCSIAELRRASDTTETVAEEVREVGKVLDGVVPGAGAAETIGGQVVEAVDRVREELNAIADRLEAEGKDSENTPIDLADWLTLAFAALGIGGSHLRRNYTRKRDVAAAVKDEVNARLPTTVPPIP